MEKFCRKGHPARFGRRWLALLMSLCLIGTMLPISARAENGSQATGLCEHHTEHTAECGYAAPVEGHECEHVHDDSCGYQEAGECTHVHTEECGEDGESCTHVHTSECGYAEGHACEHVHDDKCGYVESLEGSPCTFICDICKNEAEPEEINLSAAVMSISGFNFSLTGNDGATVKTINLNAAALRPNSTWMSGGNLVYFGTYNSNPVAYRVLSSPNTQASSENYLLLDCDTTLKTMAFDADDTKNSGQTTNPNEWKGSDLEAWLNGAEFYAGSVFSGIEKTAIAETALAEQSGYSAGNHGDSYQDYSAQNHVFCLSAAEADGLYADHNARRKTGRKYWWLRSAHSALGSNVGVVEINGVIGPNFVGNGDDVSPALNVNLSSVLLASENGMDKSSALAPVSGSSATQWKLTLRDSGKTVNVTSGQNVERRDAGGSTTITVPYTYTDSNTANPVNQISVMITDKAYTESDAQILYYGALENTTITSGGTSATGTFTLPTDLAAKACGTDYYAYIIAEKVNTDDPNTSNVDEGRYTDYAGAPAAITIPAASGSNPVTPDTPAAPVKGKGLGVSIIANPTAPTATTDAWAGSFVYFGTYNSNPVKYRVLDRITTDFGGTTMLLDCDSILWQGVNPSSRFDDDSNVWANSEIKTYLNGTFLTTGFTPLEQTAISTSTKESASRTDGNGKSNLNYAALRDDKIFLLDAKEATNTSYGYSNTYSTATNRKKPGGKDYWWLRSADSSDDRIAGLVPPGGYIYFTLVDFTLVGVSPALNVNLSSVIFSSVLSGTSGQPGAKYKLTLQDDKMTITPGTITRDSSDGITVSYTIGGTNAGSATQVSLMVLDKEYTADNTNGARLVAYEKLADAGNTRGTFTLTNDMKNGSYYYYVVAEDVNGGNATDYASAPQPITIPSLKYTVTVTDGTLSGGSTTGDYAQGETVRITADAAPGGQQFKEWTVESGNITLADSTSATTTFTMPAEAVSVKANYEAIPATAPGITIQPGGGTANPNTPGSPATPNTAYQIIDGANSSWTLGSREGLTIRGNGDFDKFTGVKVDGRLLDQSNYTAKEGSTIITLKAAYLNALAAGDHTVEILWADGSAGTTVTINASTSKDSALSGGANKKDDVPDTGDRASMVWLFIPAGLSGTGLILAARKGRKSLKASGK